MTVEVTEQVVRVEVVAGPTITVTETVPRVTETGPAQVTVQETVNQVVVAAPETVVVTEEVVRVVDIGVTDPLLTVKEGGVVVDSAVSVLDFIEPDAVLVTSSPAGEANIDMSRYAILTGRNPAQDLSGGTLTTQQFILRANAIDATGVLTLDPTLSTLAGALSLTQLTTTHASQGIIMANGSAISAAGTANFGFLTSPANSVAINAPAGVVRITTNTISLGASTSIKDTAASSRILINDPGISTIFNEDGADIDHRFEGDTDVNLLFLDAGLDRVGIGTAAPSSKLEVNGLLTATGHIRLAANGEIQDSAGAAQIIVSTTSYQVNLPNDVIVGGFLDVLGAMTAVDLTLSGILTVDSLSVGTAAVFTGVLEANAGLTVIGLTTVESIKMGAGLSILDSGGFARVTLNAGAGNTVTLNDSAAVARVAVKSTTPFVALSSSTTLNTAVTNAEAVLTLAATILTIASNYAGFHARILRATRTNAYSGILS